MTTYNTGNPIGSTDARDLYDNAQNLDNFANGSAASYTDRLGVSRRSLSGIDSAADNVLNSIGYAVPVAYASGISLTLTSQTVDYNGVIYAPKSSALPFITSSWGTDSAKFRAVQVTDADLITYTPAGTGAVATTVQAVLREQVVSVTQYATIQQALDSGAKTIRFPAGDFTFTTLSVPNDITLIGEGPDLTFLSTTTTGNAVAIGQRNTFKNLTIRQTSGTKQGKGLVGSDKYWLITENVRVLGFDYNLYCDKALYHSHKQSWFEGGNYGAYYWGVSGSWNTDWFNNVVTFDTCRFNGNTNIGTYVKGTEVIFINPDWTGCGIGLKAEGQSTSGRAHGIKVITPYAEKTDIPFSFVYAFAEINGGFVQGGTAAGAAAYTSIIDLDNSQVWWHGRPRDQDYWDYGYRVINNSSLTFDGTFGGSVRANNTVDGTSSVLYAVAETTAGATATAVASYNSVGLKKNYTDTITSVATATPTNTGVLTNRLGTAVYLVNAVGYDATNVQTIGGLAFVTIYNDGATKRAAINSISTNRFTWSSIATDGTITFQHSATGSATIRLAATRLD